MHPAAGVQRQGLAAPGVQLAQGVGLVAFKAQRGLGRGHGQHLEAHFCEQAQRAPRTRHEARDVVPGHVLHHLPTKGERLCLAVDEAHAQHIVAHRAHAGARGARQACRHHAAHGGAGGKVRRLKGQALALGGQCGLQLGQGCARAGGDDQLAGLVAGDARQRARVQHVAAQRTAMEVFGAPAPDAQGSLVGNGGAHALGDLGKGLVHAAIVPGVTLQPAPAAHEFFEQRLCSFFAAGTKKGHHGGKPGWPNA